MITRLVVLQLLFLFGRTVMAQSTEDGFFQTSDGVRIHYLDAGKGRPLVFVPGWSMPAWIWEKQIDEFSRSHRIIAVDPRSQGESDKPQKGHLPETRARDYKELIDHLGLRQPVIIGWSMACGELVKYVEQFGTSNLAGLVLVDGYLSDKASPEVFAVMAEYMNELQQDRRKQAEGFIRSTFKKPQSNAFIERLVDASTQVPADTAVTLIYNMIAMKDASSALAKMDKPMLYTYQPDSRRTADFLKAKLGDRVRLEIFEGDGHALFLDEPEKFDRVLEDFLRGLPQTE